MTWTVWAESYDTAGSLQDLSISQGLKFTKNLIVEQVRIWGVFVNNPLFANLQMKVYANDEEQPQITPTVLMHTSTNKWMMSDLITEANGLAEIYFNFTGFHAKKDVTYSFVMNGDCYFPNATSYFAWKKAYPDPVIKEGFVPTAVNIGVSPLEIFVAGTEL